MDSHSIKTAIIEGKTVLGIELGSTRIKAVLIDEAANPIASGSYDWENRLESGIWTYHLEDAWTGIQASFRNLSAETQKTYGVDITKLAGIGFSGMMHGYLPFDAEGSLLTPFRTWRNTMTEQAAAELTERLGFNIPQRWSIAHLYQAILSKEQHVPQIAYLTTLAGYIHWQLTGEKVLGVGDASGMFPIDAVSGNDFDAAMVAKWDAIVAPYGFPWTLKDIMPKVLCAGEEAGCLTTQGARLIDPTGKLQAGIPLCPPEGDAGTGMVATNSVLQRTGNVSAGTSIFAMIVLEKALSKVYTEIDMVTTPSGKPVAMAHGNNCTSDINAWAGLLREFALAMGADCSMQQVLVTLFNRALEADADCGGLLSYNYLSGEPITGLDEGRPLFARLPDSPFSLANFARTHIYSALATLRLGMEILVNQEHVQVDALLGHGGFFKTKDVGQKLMAGALRIPISVMETAGEGGPWGMALLAAYRIRKSEGQPLEEYLDQQVFANSQGSRIDPDDKDSEGFDVFMKRYQEGLDIERAAVTCLH